MAVAQPMAFQTVLDSRYNSVPSLRPLNSSVQCCTKFLTRFSQIKCMKLYGKDNGNKMDERYERRDVPLFSYSLTKWLASLLVGDNCTSSAEQEAPCECAL